MPFNPHETPFELTQRLIRNFHKCIHGTETPQKFDVRSRDCARYCLQLMISRADTLNELHYYNRAKKHIDKVEPLR